MANIYDSGNIIAWCSCGFKATIGLYHEETSTVLSDIPAKVLNATYKLPKLANALSRRIKEITSNLRVKNIDCSFTTDSAVNKTRITLRQLNSIPVIPGTSKANSTWESQQSRYPGIPG